jgi:hypothetical protein
MNTITTKLIIDLQHPSPDNIVYAMKGDKCRHLNITLLSNGTNWSPSADGSLYEFTMTFIREGTSVRRTKTIETDDPSEIPVSDNVISVDLDSNAFRSQICDEAGVYFVIYSLTETDIFDGQTTKFSTFPIRVVVLDVI